VLEVSFSLAFRRQERSLATGTWRFHSVVVRQDVMQGACLVKDVRLLSVHVVRTAYDDIARAEVIQAYYAGIVCDGVSQIGAGHCPRRG